MSCPRLAAVVLSWNGRKETLACLRSLAEVGYEPFDVVVVDNASADGSADAVAAEFPGVELVRSERNLGYAGGMNLGAERALARGAEHVLLLNNDTVVDADAPGALVAEAERRPGAAALCPVVYFAEPPDVIWYAGARLDPRRAIRASTSATHLLRCSETERACGAALLVPARAIAELGLFDEELFAYAEDADWSLRAREAGHRAARRAGGPGLAPRLVCDRRRRLGRARSTTASGTCSRSASGTRRSAGWEPGAARGRGRRARGDDAAPAEPRAAAGDPGRLPRLQARALRAPALSPRPRSRRSSSSG